MLSDLFPSDFLAAILCAFHICAVHATCRSVTHLDMMILIIFVEGPYCKVPQSPALYYFSPLASNIFVSIMFSNELSFC